MTGIELIRSKIILFRVLRMIIDKSYEDILLEQLSSANYDQLSTKDKLDKRIALGAIQVIEIDRIQREEKADA